MITPLNPLVKEQKCIDLEKWTPGPSLHDPVVGSEWGGSSFPVCSNKFTGSSSRRLGRCGPSHRPGVQGREDCNYKLELDCNVCSSCQDAGELADTETQYQRVSVADKVHVFPRP
ncbi:hypothetical protein Q5P01_007972 [Channa striata]|uniref:Uncharacterized protein n=1 Tax=Channa striata TaxID=64152 RepID=A0AA88SWU0_CHASR|nr:hypothetical protein Q5P01_007972 [Channa striata]